MTSAVFDASELPVGAVEEALRSAGVELELPARLQRTRYDSFDGGLWRAGLQLETRAHGAQAHTLRVTGGGGPSAQLFLATALPQGTPLQLTALPRGPLRSRLLAAAKDRALLPQLTLTSHRASGTLEVDGIPQAVVHLDTDLEVEPAGDGGPRTTIEVEALPGRDTAAEALRHRLAAALRETTSAAGLDAPLQGDGLRLAATRAGVDLRGWRGPLRPELDRRAPALVGVRTVLRSFADALDANWQGTTDHIDDAFLHEFRVALRRTRSLLAQSRRVLPADVRRDQRDAFRWLGTVTSSARDLDVYVASWQELTDLLDPVDAAELEPVLAHLAGQRAEAHGEVARALGSDRAHQLRASWRAWLEQPDDQVTGGRRAEEPLGRVVGARILAAQERVLERGRSIRADSPATELHELRKDGKRLRYLLEAFGHLGGRKRSAATITHLTHLQDNLGAFQDAHVQAERLRMVLAEMTADGGSRRGASPRPGTLEAGARLATALDRQREQARADFDARFADYRRKRARRTLTELVDRMSR